MVEPFYPKACKSSRSLNPRDKMLDFVREAHELEVFEKHELGRGGFLGGALLRV